MRRSPYRPRSLAGRDSTRGFPRLRVAAISLARMALVCYLMPVILLVFAIGGLAIGAGRLRQILDSLGAPPPSRASSMRWLVALPLVSRKASFTGGSGAYRERGDLR